MCAGEPGVRVRKHLLSTQSLARLLTYSIAYAIAYVIQLQEIQAYVEKVTGASKEDPFEGMTPEEINEYVAKHGMPAGMQ